MPECRIPLAHAAIYIATAPKSNAAYKAIDAATRDIEQGRTLAVPVHLRTKTRKKLAEDAGGATKEDTEYRYSHDYEDGFVPQAYMSEGRRYYFPTNHGLEQRIAERLDHWRERFKREANKPPGR
jgi:putative ATPase